MRSTPVERRGLRRRVPKHAPHHGLLDAGAEGLPHLVGVQGRAAGQHGSVGAHQGHAVVRRLGQGAMEGLEVFLRHRDRYGAGEAPVRRRHRPRDVELEGAAEKPGVGDPDGEAARVEARQRTVTEARHTDGASGREHAEVVAIPDVDGRHRVEAAVRGEGAVRVDQEQRADLLQPVLDRGEVGVARRLILVRRRADVLVDAREDEFIGVEGGGGVLLQHLGGALGLPAGLGDQDPMLLRDRRAEQQGRHDERGGEQDAEAADRAARRKGRWIGGHGSRDRDRRADTGADQHRESRL